MSTGDITFDIQDGALGFSSVSDNEIPILFGVSSDGNFDSLELYSSGDALKLVCKTGPLVEAGCNYLDHPGVSAIRIVRVNQLQCGAVTETVASPAGTMTTTGSLPLDFYEVEVIITTGGALGTAIMKYSLDDGVTYVTGVAIPVDGSVTIADTGLILIFGGTFVADENFSFDVVTDSTLTAVEKVAAGSTDGALETTGSTPLDAFNVRVDIAQGGVLGEASFKFTLDGTDTDTQPEYAIPGSGVYEIPNTGIILTFTDGVGSPGFDAGDKFTFQTTAPGYTLAALQNAVQVWIDSTREAAFLHILGEATAAVGEAMVTMIDDAAVEHKFSFLLMETVDQTEATVAEYLLAVDTDWADTLSERLCVVPGYVDLLQVNTKLVVRRSFARGVGPRLAAIAFSEDPGKYASGPIRNVQKTYVDARLHKTLNDKGYTLARTYDLETAIYCREGKMKVLPTSDYKFIKERRVMDVACSEAYRALKLYINANVQVSRKTGFITEMAARGVDLTVTSALEQKLFNTDPMHVSGVRAQTRRDNNIISSQTLYVTIRIIPMAKISEIKVDIGFENPAISTT